MLRWLPPLLWLALLLAASLGMAQLEPLLRWFDPDSHNLLYQRASLAGLLGQHLLIVACAGSLAVLLGLGAAILVTRPWGRDFLPLASQVASIGQTFPPVAVLALSVPLLGFGALPSVVALLLYGLLPVLRNSLAGLQGVPCEVLEAARGMGMSAPRMLWQVELPLAWPVILAGIRTCLTLSIATAALGSTVGASTLGDPLIAGLVNGNTAYLLQGALLIGLLAVAVDSLCGALARRCS